MNSKLLNSQKDNPAYKVENTLQLLKLVAQHLSGRHSTDKVEYIVSITEDSISLDPIIYVYPSRYDRKPEHKTHALHHILTNHSFVDENGDPIDTSSFEILNSDIFVLGKYRYACSFNGKKRRWIQNTDIR